MVPATATQKIVESIFHSWLTIPSTLSTLYGINKHSFIYRRLILHIHSELKDLKTFDCTC